MTEPEDQSSPLNERVWEQGWEGHEFHQRRRMASLTLAQKLEWLEQAHRLVMQLQKSRLQSPGPNEDRAHE